MHIFELGTWMLTNEYQTTKLNGKWNTKNISGSKLLQLYQTSRQQSNVFSFCIRLCPLTSKYHKMDTNDYPNIFGCHIMYQTNILIYSNETYLPNKYPNIFVLRIYYKYKYK